MVKRQEIFDIPEEKWLDVERILCTDIPDGFDMDVITMFLSLSELMINDKPYNLTINKPTKKGRNMYLSKCIKRAWFCITDDHDYLLFRCQMAGSYADKK